MTRLAAATVAFVLALPAASAAHRLDEYLQAARVSLTREHITLELDMTPGVNIAQALSGFLDRNGDGDISEGEARAYGDRVLADVIFELDGRPVRDRRGRDYIEHRLGRRDGQLQVRAHGPQQPSPPPWQLYFRNDHSPLDRHLVNALSGRPRARGGSSPTPGAVSSP